MARLLSARERRALAPKPPLGVAHSYGAVLDAWLNRFQSAILTVVLTDWDQNPTAFGPGGRTDASGFTKKKLAGIKLLLEQNLDPAQLNEHIKKFARRVAKAGESVTPVTRSSILDKPGLPGGQYRRVIGITNAELGVQAEVIQFQKQNVSLIKSLAENQLTDIEQLLGKAETGAWRVEVLQGQIQKDFGVNKSKARLLARDQVLKLNGKLIQLRQTNIGIRKYIWTTSHDERVRPSHDDLDGTECLWSAPPVVSDDGRTAHPGQDFQCRCIPFPILNELDEEEGDE